MPYSLPDAALTVFPHELMEKGWQTLPVDKVPASPPRSHFEDPFSSIHSYGYKQKRWSPTYKLLKLAVDRIGLLSAIINTRINQVSMFSMPYRQTNTLGYAIRHRDRRHSVTRSEERLIVELEDYVYTCGRGKKNPYSVKKRDSFRTFLAKIVRDRLRYDQACFEVNLDTKGMPFEFMAVDGSTIKISTSYREKSDFKGLGADILGPSLLSIQARKTARDRIGSSDIAYLQVLDGRILKGYTENQMAFCPYNLDSDIYTAGYGVPEIEMITRVLTGILDAESYNFNFFKNSSVPKGILAIKTPMEGEMLESFKRQWDSQIKGTSNVFRTPILQTDQAEWIDLNMSHKDAEFINWLHYLIRIVCAVYLIDPAEINFDISSQIPAQPQYDTQAEWRVKKSKDKGLRPLLKFLADSINENIITKIAPDFYLSFEGLDDLSQKEKQDLIAQQMTLYTTINEGRHKDDLPPLPYGDIPANPIYLQHLQMIQQQVQMEQQMQIEAKQPAAAKKSFDSHFPWYK